MFRLFFFPVNFFIRSVHFQTICDEMILRSISEARIWFPTVTFVTLITRVTWIEEWFLIDIFISLLLKAFLGWAWSSTMTAPWLIIFSLSWFLRKFPARWWVICSDRETSNRIEEIRKIHWSKIIIYIWPANWLLEVRKFSKKSWERKNYQSWCSHCGGSRPT